MECLDGFDQVRFVAAEPKGGRKAGDRTGKQAGTADRRSTKRLHIDIGNFDTLRDVAVLGRGQQRDQRVHISLYGQPING